MHTRPARAVGLGDAVRGETAGMEEYEEAARRDDPVESGALEDEGGSEPAETPPRHDEPVESGALEDADG